MTPPRRPEENFLGWSALAFLITLIGGLVALLLSLGARKPTSPTRTEDDERS